MDSFKFSFRDYTKKIDQFLQTRQNGQGTRLDTVESHAQSGGKAHDFSSSMTHYPNRKAKLLQQWKEQPEQEQSGDPSVHLGRRKEKSLYKQQQLQRKLQQWEGRVLFTRNDGQPGTQDNEELLQIDTAVQAHDPHEKEVVVEDVVRSQRPPFQATAHDSSAIRLFNVLRFQRLPFQATAHDPSAIQLFQGIPLSIEGAEAIREMPLTFQEMLLRFATKQKNATFLMVLGECANAGYLQAVISMINRQKKLVELIKDWPTHRATLRFMKESNFSKSVSSIQGGKGMPTLQNIIDLIAWCSNEQGEVNSALLRSIAGMQNRKGMPTRQNINDLIAWCSNEQGEVDITLLRAITSMQTSRGMPSEQDINDLIAWCTNEQGEVDITLLRFITSKQHGKGMPSEEKFEALKRQYRLKRQQSQSMNP